MKLIIRGRMHEFGILLSIGIKKNKIVGQTLLECLTISTLALALAVFLSGSLASVCFHTAERLTAPDSQEEAYRVSLREGMFPEMDKVTSDEVALSGEVTIQTAISLILLVSGITAASAFLASIQIFEMEPTRLLRSM